MIGQILPQQAAALLQRKSRREEKEEEAKGLLDQAGRNLKGTGRWLGEKAETVKEKAGVRRLQGSLPGFLPCTASKPFGSMAKAGSDLCHQCSTKAMGLLWGWGQCSTKAIGLLWGWGQVSGA